MLEASSALILATTARLEARRAGAERFAEREIPRKRFEGAALEAPATRGTVATGAVAALMMALMVVGVWGEWWCGKVRTEGWTHL